MSIARRNGYIGVRDVPCLMLSTHQQDRGIEFMPSQRQIIYPGVWMSTGKESHT